MHANDAHHASALEKKLVESTRVAVWSRGAGTEERCTSVAFTACLSHVSSGAPFAIVYRATSEEELETVDELIRSRPAGTRALVWLHVLAGAEFDADDINGWLETVDERVHMLLTSDDIDEARATVDALRTSGPYADEELEADSHTDATPADWNAAYEQVAHHVSRRQRDLSSRQASRAKSLGRQASSFKGVTSFKKKGGAFSEVNGYKVGRRLGKGAYGEVHVATKGGERYALKILKQSKQSGGRGRGASGLDSVQKEIATMKKIAHPNCVALFDVIADPETVDEICLLLEFVDGGTSQKSDAQSKPIPLSLDAVWSHMRHLVMGLEYLHMHGIVHRDVRLLARSRPPDLRPLPFSLPL